MNSSKILSEYYNGRIKDSMSNYIDIVAPEVLLLNDIKFDKHFKYDVSGLYWNNVKINKTNSQDIANIEKIQFNSCQFDNIPIIIEKDIWSIEFNNCIFKNSSVNLIKALFLDNEDSSKRVIFNNCQFSNFTIGDITDIKYNLETKLCKFYLHGGVIERLTIQNIELDTKLYFNRQDEENTLSTKVDRLVIENSVLLDNFKLHHCNVASVTIKDTDFQKQADFYKSSFDRGINKDEDDKSIYFKALNFNGLTIFGDCVFNEKVLFSEVSFEDFAHFKKAYFNKGLDIDYANIKKGISFFGVTGLDSKLSNDNTTQETYRIIKHNFLKVGNQIEANKYHSLELDVHRKYMWKKLKKEFSWKMLYEETQELFELLSNLFPSVIQWITSKYTQSWLLPLFWILVVGWLSNWLMSDWSNSCNINGILKHVSIANLDKELTERPAIFLFNKISLGYLYYQFIAAIRKNTKK